jgi:bifunctional non-homologous end joining protein LigD
MSIPQFVEPQLALLVVVPPQGPGWVTETKFDGYRMQMRVTKGSASLRTRKGLDWTAKLPEIAAEGGAPPDCLIDGEICAVGRSRNSDFGALQLALAEGETGKLVFFLFDCLYAAGREGIISKQLTAPSRSERGTSWTKAKCRAGDTFPLDPHAA